MSSTPFATILDHHFKMNKDYLLDLVQDLLQSEQELSQSLGSTQGSSESKIPNKIRGKLVEWMIQLCDELKLGYKTKQTAVILADLSLAKLNIHKNFLQLLGITCIFISIKCEESFTYTLDHACNHCANTYSKEEIGAMEMLIYKTLKWKLNYPTPGDMARRLVHLSGATTMANMPKFFKKVDNFIDLCLSEHDMSIFTPSAIAAASIMCAFGSSQAYIERWREMMMNNGLFQLDFNSIDALYKNTVHRLMKYRPEYFALMFSTPNELEVKQKACNSPHLQEDFQHDCGSSQTTAECSQEMSVMSFGSQETSYEPNNNDAMLESLSHVGTPTKTTPTKDDGNSLLDTENLMTSTVDNESNQTNWNCSESTAMDEERND